MPISVFSQSIKFVLYGYNPCTESVEQLSSFGLLKDGVTYSVSDSTGILSLEEEGSYSLSYVIENIDTTQLGRLYNLQMTRDTFSDTLYLESIYSCLEPTSHPNFIEYCCCGMKCEGEKSEYYSNGNKRIEGCFKDGIPVGELKLYYPNGHFKQIDFYSKKGKMFKRVLYDNMGNIMRIETY